MARRPGSCRPVVMVLVETILLLLLLMRTMRFLSG